MKKILTILASAATLFAFGEGINQGADFEAFTAGNAFSAGLNDSAQQSTPLYWYTADTDAANIISNYPTSGVGVPIDSRPDMFSTSNNTQYLQVETTGKLYRTVKNNSGSDDFTTNVTATYAHSLADAPIYLDTLVKFTAADSVFGDDALADGDKIAIEYVEHESEGGDDPTVTNFVVRAGLIAGEVLSQTNYFVAVPVGFDKDAWHRLTVRTIPEVGTTENPGGVGFVIYLDETNLTYSTSVDAGFGTLNATAQGFYNTTKHALFPSAIPADGTGGKTISAAAFSGNGSLDDVVFTTTTPEFVASGETPKVTVTWDTNVVSAITIAGVAVTNEEFAAGSMLVALTNTTLAVTATPVAGYELVYDPTYENGAFTGLSAGDNCTITGFIPLFDVDGVHYAELSDAIEAAADGTSANPATLKLLADCNQALNFTEGYIILDLAGCDIEGNGSDFSIGNSGATLIITNSGAEASVKIPADNGAGGEGTGPLMAAGGFTTIQAGTFEGTILTAADDDTTFKQDFVGITGGKFLFPGYDDEDPTSFYLYACVAQDLGLTQSGDYVVVGTAAPQPTTYEISWTLTGGTTTETSGDDFAENATIVFTADSGKTLSFVSIDGTEIADTSVYGASSYTYTVGTADAVLVVTFTEPPAPIGTYEVVVTPDANATYAAICTNDDSAVVFNENITTVRVGYAIMITATPNANYAYATTPDGWTAGENGVITKVVDVAGTVAIPAPTATGGKTYPSYITDATAQGKYDAWATANNISATDFPDTGNAYQDAYLLNIAPDATDQTLKAASITISGSTVTITANQDLTSVNGKVYIKVATTLAGLSTAEWAEATLSEGEVQVTPGSSDTAGFYKIKVDF